MAGFTHTKLSQDTIQLPAEDKQEVNEIAGKFGYLRAGQPSRSRVYQEFVRFALENFQDFLNWRQRRINERFKRIKGVRSEK